MTNFSVEYLGGFKKLIYIVADLWNNIKQETLEHSKAAKEPPAGTKPTINDTVYTKEFLYIYFCLN